MISAIVAVDSNWGIGFQGKLLETIPEDLKRFKQLTTGNGVVMGRKTWDSLPIKPLPNRFNIIISRHSVQYQQEDSCWWMSLEECLMTMLNDDINDYYIIGTQLTESNFDFFGGSGFSCPQDKSNASAPNLYDLAEQKGYTIAGGYADAKNKIGNKKLLVVPEERLADRSRHAGALPYAIDREDKDLRLSQIVELAIAQLSRHERFFMMAEGGKIDYASHANDGATVLHEVMDFDEAIKVAYRFYEQHPDETLIVITADHETGGMALGNSDYVLNLKALANQQCSLDKLSDQLSELQKAEGKNLQWEQVRQLISKNTGLYAQVEMTGEEDALLQESFASMMSHQDVVKTLYKDLNALAAKALAILNKKSRLGWTSGGHTASAVPIFAIGVGAERFTGWHDNSEIAPLIYQATQYR